MPSQIASRINSDLAVAKLSTLCAKTQAYSVYNINTYSL